MKNKKRIKDLEFDIERLTQALDTLYNVVEVLSIKAGVEFFYDLEGLVVGGVNCSEDLKSSDIQKLLESHKKIEVEETKAPDEGYIKDRFPNPNTAIITAKAIENRTFVIGSKLRIRNEEVKDSDHKLTFISDGKVKSEITERCFKSTESPKQKLEIKGTNGDIEEYQKGIEYEVGKKVYIMDYDDKIILEVVEAIDWCDCCYFDIDNLLRYCKGAICNSSERKDRNRIIFKEVEQF